MSNGVIFYEHINYQGKQWTFDSNQSFIESANDQFSSVKIPAGTTVQLFEHRDYGGRSTTLTSDAADLRAHGPWNDAASSVKFNSAGTGGTGKAVRLKKGKYYVECNSGGIISLTDAKTDGSKVVITRHADKHYDATFAEAKKVLSIEPDGRLTSRPEGTYGPYEMLDATTQPDPNPINLLYRVSNGQICGGTVLQIVEE